MIHDGIIERLISLLLANLDHAGDLMRLSFADEISNSDVDDENFQSSDATGLVDPLKQILRDYAFERFSQRGANLVLLAGREHINDAVNRLGGAGCVQSTENKVAGRGRGER